jgi:pyruvate/2-oxoglutarate dehydrogenase complex dihydrolipoamide dehydrogenase (E3) component
MERAMVDTDYDVIVLGGGATGEVLAARVVSRGLTAVLVEAELVGGECSYWACIPSKVLLRSPGALQAARQVDGARQALTGDLDADAVLARRNAFTHGWRDDGQVQWLADESIAFVRGWGRLAGERRVDVTAPDGSVTSLVARHAVAICTGSAALVPPLPGLAEARPWTSRDATCAKRPPGRLAVIGGGVVACEMATAWRALGAREVTMLVRSHVLGELEPFVGERLVAAFRARGIDVRTGVNVTEVRRANPGGPVVVNLDHGRPVTADEVLVATGRRPRTTDLGLETIGLTAGDWLEVDDTCRVTAVAGGWLYAAGDVNRRALLTHMGKYQARVGSNVIVARARGEEAARAPAPWSPYAATANHASVPQVVFTDPEVAAVGLTESQARAAGIDAWTAEYELGDVPGAAIYADGYAGHAKLVVDRARRVVVGATFLGPDVGELLHSATIAVVGEVPLERLWHAIPSYPTIGEVWLRLLEGYGLSPWAAPS